MNSASDLARDKRTNDVHRELIEAPPNASAHRNHNAASQTMTMDDTQRIVKCGNLALHTPGGFFKVSPGSARPIAALKRPRPQN